MLKVSVILFVWVFFSESKDLLVFNAVMLVSYVGVFVVTIEQMPVTSNHLLIKCTC